MQNKPRKSRSAKWSTSDETLLAIAEAEKNIKIAAVEQNKKRDSSSFYFDLAEILDEVKEMELTEIRQELENMASRLADFRGSL